VTGWCGECLGSYRVRRIRVVAVLVAVLVIVTGAPHPAWAHNALVGTTPEDGTAVAAAPAAIVLTFNEPAVGTGTKVLVTGPDGSATSGDPALIDNTVRQRLQSDLPAGKYTVDWRVTSADGHPINGTFTFEVRSSGGTSGSASPAPSTSATPSMSSAPSMSAASSTSATPSTSATASTGPTLDGAPEGADTGSPWWWLLAIIPVGLAAALGWRFSRRNP
jgi:methionine-rich copper-binding protein CopC